MTIRHVLIGVIVVTALHLSGRAFAGVEKVCVLKEIDDNTVVVTTRAGDRLLLERWTLRFSPLLFEGQCILAEVSPMWITMYFDDRDPIKWSVKEHLGSALPGPSGTPRMGPKVEHGVSRHRASTACYNSTIQAPKPFLGNGGEAIVLADGTIWKDVSYQYLYLYEYYPSVTVCPSEGKMIDGKHVFQVVPVK